MSWLHPGANNSLSTGLWPLLVNLASIEQENNLRMRTNGILWSWLHMMAGMCLWSSTCSERCYIAFVAPGAGYSAQTAPEFFCLIFSSATPYSSHTFSKKEISWVTTCVLAYELIALRGTAAKSATARRKRMFTYWCIHWSVPRWQRSLYWGDQ